jgi:Flp pilus assembly pilin Flp
MWIPFLSLKPKAAPVVDAQPTPTNANGKERRRGTTAMEYLVCLTFIIVVVIIAVQSLGIETGKLFTKNANATNSTIKTGP